MSRTRVVVYVYEYIGSDGGGLVFVGREHRRIYDNDDYYDYLGTISDFVRMVKKAIRRGKIYSTVYVE